MKKFIIFLFCFLMEQKLCTVTSERVNKHAYVLIYFHSFIQIYKYINTY